MSDSDLYPFPQHGNLLSKIKYVCRLLVSHPHLLLQGYYTIRELGELHPWSTQLFLNLGGDSMVFSEAGSAWSAFSPARALSANLCNRSSSSQIEMAWACYAVATTGVSGGGGIEDATASGGINETIGGGGVSGSVSCWVLGTVLASFLYWSSLEPVYTYVPSNFCYPINLMEGLVIVGIWVHEGPRHLRSSATPNSPSIRIRTVLLGKYALD